ncbi:hypothetical protein COV24_00985 [candidate division WWE3 bacterium CG10_big_fil_rev_8_21_14_0_10_32_10]|uniref:Dockerin domain-containing protein n=1 Tax=candidate division WWE3 bacterium CG10_big_fil_rev_8_21_14_0_10_32_10 TaxID=1975090 RepID=A0A2H0RB93_UNCKA|nr:MAG: hypothetical protein COV24_00985 [candidate division WWE3 bacterium CG10_big_fil_rev_8_21_14_0_10_32_10]
MKTRIKILFIVIIGFAITTAPAYAISGYNGWNLYSNGYVPKPFTNHQDRIASLNGWRIKYDASNRLVLSTFPLIGLREDFSRSYMNNAYKSPIQLGRIEPVGFPTSFASTPSESADWVRRSYTYTFNTNTFTLTSSRLTPGILVESDSSALNLFTGQKSALQQATTSWGSGSTATYATVPIFIAYSSGGQIVIQEISPTNPTLTFSNMDTDWILMWYGTNSFLWGSNKVLFPGRGIGGIYDPSKWLGKVDMPVLVVTQNKPQSLTFDTANGGYILDYGSSNTVGLVNISPLYGNCYPYVDNASAFDSSKICAPETKNWNAGLPQEVKNRVTLWNSLLGTYPFSVFEEYSLLPNSDVTITNTFSFKSVTGENYYAPVPPVLTLAADEGLPIQFNLPQGAQIVDTDTPISIGPYKTVEGLPVITDGQGNKTVSYSYTIQGLSKYANAKRIITDTGSGASTYLQTTLKNETKAIIDAGHLAPWWPKFGKESKVWDEMPTWSQTWETPYYLGQVMDVVPSGMSASLNNYIDGEITSYPPESYVRTVSWLNAIQTLPYSVGTRRESGYIEVNQDESLLLTNPYHRFGIRNLMTLYMFGEYYNQNRNVSDLQNRWQNIQNIYKSYVTRQTWDTNTMTQYTWDQGTHKDILRGGIGETNRLIASSIGFYRMADILDEQEGKDFALYILNKALISRFTQDKLVKYLYESNLQTIPDTADWLVQNSLQGGGETGWETLWRDNWTGYQDDVRRPLLYDQLGVVLADYFPIVHNPELVPYTHLTPELGHFIKDYLLPEATEWKQAVEENNAAWYKAYGDVYLGTEHSIDPPQNAYQVFTVAAWALQEPATKLHTYINIPWVPLGDYYYIDKLAETIKAYRGWCWSIDDGQTCDDGSVPSITGDLNNDNTVNIQDIIILINEIFTPSGVQGSDINNDGKVDILDVIQLINIIFS